MPAAEDALLELCYPLTPESPGSGTDAVLRRLASERLTAVAERRVLNELRRRTSIPISTLVAEVSNYRQQLPENKPAGWTASLHKDDHGDTLPLAINVLTALQNDRAWHGVLQLNQFQQRPWIVARPPWGTRDWKPRAFTDADEARVLVWMQENGIRVQERAVKSALKIAFDDLQFHPVRDFLDKLEWDGRPRLDMAPSYYFGCTVIPNYTERVFSKWMISAVARVYEPGCIAKYVLILEGPQDLKKSMALETLGKPWFTDDIETLGSKDSKLQVGNAWIIELAELAATAKTDVDTIKAFISRKVDKFRRPYGENLVEQERQCVLAGTINPTDPYFKDDSGNVRLWPMACTAIDIDALTADRNQLWAEAVHRYRAGEKWWIEDDQVRAVVLTEQGKRQPIEAWHGTIDRWLATPTDGRFRERVTTDEVMSGALGMKPGDSGWNRGSQTTIGRVLRALGWGQDPANQERPRPYFKP